MAKLKLWFLDVGHGDCAFVIMPNGSRILIDCGCDSSHWPSKMLNYYSINGKESPISISGAKGKYGLDILVITHPHGDHIADIEAIHDEVCFFMLLGKYRPFIDKISPDKIDFRKRNEQSIKKFIEVVEKYKGKYDKDMDRTISADPPCAFKYRRFIDYEENIDLNELSWFTSFAIGNHKILFTGDMTTAGIKKILQSANAQAFINFVKGTTILKVPHHGRTNGCSQELFDAFGCKPLLCIISDEVLNEINEGTCATQWYEERVSDKKVMINGEMQDRWVLTTRKDKDIYIGIDENSSLEVTTNCFAKNKEEILRK